VDEQRVRLGRERAFSGAVRGTGVAQAWAQRGDD